MEISKFLTAIDASPWWLVILAPSICFVTWLYFEYRNKGEKPQVVETTHPNKQNSTLQQEQQISIDLETRVNEKKQTAEFYQFNQKGDFGFYATGHINEDTQSTLFIFHLKENIKVDKITIESLNTAGKEYPYIPPRMDEKYGCTIAVPHFIRDRVRVTLVF